MSLSPIIIFVYNRPWHLGKTVNALKNNDLAKESELFIFSDGPKNELDNLKIREVREYIKTIKGFQKLTIFETKKHLGLADSVISGVSKTIDHYGKVIVMEDDLISSPNFLKFMNQALDFYRNDKRIFSVTGYNYPIKIPSDYEDPVYLAYRCTSWGWGTWKDRWEKVDWKIKDYAQFSKSERARISLNRGGEDLTTLLDYQMKGLIDSWAIRFCYAHYKNNAFCLHPTVSKIRNIGLDGSGTHKTVSKVIIKLDKGEKEILLPPKLKVNKKILSNFSKYFRKNMQSRFIDIFKWVMNLVGLKLVK